MVKVKNTKFREKIDIYDGLGKDHKSFLVILALKTVRVVEKRSRALHYTKNT